MPWYKVDFFLLAPASLRSRVEYLPVLITLALRNILRHLPRLRAFIIALTLVFSLLFAGNSVLQHIDRIFFDTYTRTLTGDISFSDPAADGFTIFGSETVLVGQYLTMPVMANGMELLQSLRADEGVESVAGVVIGAARMEFAGERDNVALFGVDFADYFDLFTEVKVVAGNLPGVGEPGVFLQEERWAQMDPRPEIGDQILFSYTDGVSFTLREAPLRGIIRYPVEDSAIERTVLIDAPSARSLFGILRADLDTRALENGPYDIEGALDLDSLFSEPQLSEETLELASSDVELWEGLDDLFSTLPEALAEPTGGSYHFVLVRLHDKGAAKALASTHSDYRVLDWRQTGGGTIQLVSLVQVFLNLGLIFLVIGAVIVTTNSLALSVLERRKEIGTMRALGAQRSTVSLMVVLETSLIVFGSMTFGILMGSAIVTSLNILDLSINNRYLKLLFGGGSVRGSIDLALLAWHLLASVLLALLASVYPLRKVLSLTPVKAMST